jgi:hypothetical protein
MLPSVRGMGDKLGELMRTINFQPNNVLLIEFLLNDVVSQKLFCCI